MSTGGEARPLKVALLQPCYWPEVRRGTERVVHDLGVQLAARGHQVTLITSHAASAEDTLEQGMRVIRTRRPPTPGPLRWYEDHLLSIPAVTRHLLGGGFDVVNAFFASYAWAAVKARRMGAPPVVFSFHGIPIREYLVDRRYRMEMLHTTVAGAAEVTVLSEEAAKVFRRHLLRNPVVLPAGFLGDGFGIEIPRDDRPTIFCASSLSDRRKRADLLFAAFEGLRTKRPDAVLRLAPPPGTEPAAGSLPDGTELVTAAGTEELAALYARSHATVLAAPGEALGLVLIESLASGTPVVAARSGAGPEIVDDERVGRLFEVDDRENLVAAMDQAIDLAGHEGTRSACVARAGDFEWRNLIADHERVLYRAARSLD